MKENDGNMSGTQWTWTQNITYKSDTCCKVSTYLMMSYKFLIVAMKYQSDVISINKSNISTSGYTPILVYYLLHPHISIKYSSDYYYILLAIWVRNKNPGFQWPGLNIVKQLSKNVSLSLGGSGRFNSSCWGLSSKANLKGM